MHKNWRHRVMETYDLYSPKYQSYHKYPEIYRWFQEAKIKNIHLPQSDLVALQGEI